MSRRAASSLDRGDPTPEWAKFNLLRWRRSDTYAALPPPDRLLATALYLHQSQFGQILDEPADLMIAGQGTDHETVRQLLPKAGFERVGNGWQNEVAMAVFTVAQTLIEGRRLGGYLTGKSNKGKKKRGNAQHSMLSINAEPSRPVPSRPVPSSVSPLTLPFGGTELTGPAPAAELLARDFVAVVNALGRRKLDVRGGTFTPACARALKAGFTRGDVLRAALAGLCSRNEADRAFFRERPDVMLRFDSKPKTDGSGNVVGETKPFLRLLLDRAPEADVVGRVGNLPGEVRERIRALAAEAAYLRPSPVGVVAPAPRPDAVAAAGGGGATPGPSDAS